MANAGNDSGSDQIARAFEHLVQEEPLAPARPKPSKSGRRGGPPQEKPQENDSTGNPALEQLGRRVDRLADLISSLPTRATDDRAVDALSTELKGALSAFRLQVQTDLAKIGQRVTSETSTLRSELQAALALATDVPAADKDQRQAAVVAVSDHIRSLLSEERKAFRAHLDTALAEQTERMQSTLADERRAVKSELSAALVRLADQAAEERKERRGELHAAVVNSTERLRSVLVDERKELRGELQIVLPDVLRHRAEEWQQLRAALDASLNQSAEGTQHAITQFGQQLADLRRDLLANLAKANDRRGEEREQLSREFQAALATTAKQLGDDQRRLRGALDASLAQAKNERLALEASVGKTGERTGEVLAELSQRLVELRRELTGVLEELREQQAEAVAQVRSDFRTGLVNSHNQLVTQQRELNRGLEARLAREREARVQDSLKQSADVRAALDEISRTVTEDRQELRLALAATVEAANQWFTQLRDHLYERLETVIDVTAQSSASAASAIKALRRDLHKMEADPRLLEALAQLNDEIERLHNRIPARVALRLPDNQLAAIVEAVRAPARAGSKAAPGPAAPKATAKVSKAAKPAARTRAAAGAKTAGSTRAAKATKATSRPIAARKAVPPAARLAKAARRMAAEPDQFDGRPAVREGASSPTDPRVRAW